jgi:hypothetical protein
VGAWYQTADGEYLEVVALDPEEGTIEVQFYDGNLAEYDEGTWDRELELRRAAPPEDWADPLDIGNDDYGVDLDRPAGEFHSRSFDLLDEDQLEGDLD